MNPTTRRALAAALIIGVSAIAGYAGWRTQRHVDQATPAPKISDSALRQLMALQLPDSDGRPQALQQWQGKVLVINFWATWCPPCVKEMPELDRLQREQGPAGVQVVGLAIDQPDSVRRFLKQTPVSFPIGLAGFEGSEIGRQLGNSAGGLPFTAVFDRQGQVVERKLGPTDFAELSGWVARIRS